MARILLIGLGAGAASALLFTSVLSGALIAILLFYLAPLPIMIAALGWSHWAGLTGAAAATAALGVLLGPYYALAFLIGVAAPGYWLPYLALLARPVGGNGAGHLEWYPPGRIVLWAALLGALLVVTAILGLGADEQSFQAGLRRAFEQIFSSGGDATTDLPSTVDVKRLIDFLIAAVPPGAAVVAIATSTISLWLAGRTVRLSGRLRRPWPDLSAITLPRAASLLLAIAIVATFIPGIMGIIAGVLTASLMMAFAIAGLAVLHAITRGMNVRPFILATVYAIVFIFGWPAVGLALLGITDAAFDVRGRVAARRQSSANKPPPD